MNDNKPIHPLARPFTKAGSIRFIWHKDGKEHKFSSAINDLTGERLAWFNGHPPERCWSLKEVRDGFAKIRKENEVLEVIGDF